MTDRLQYLKYLQIPPETVTPSQFSAWKKSAVTRTLLRDMLTAVFDELDAPLPEDFDKTIVTVHQREGALKIIDQLFNWEPQSVAEARAKGVLEETDDQ